jgi:hypothetical protein
MGAGASSSIWFSHPITDARVAIPWVSPGVSPLSEIVVVHRFSSLPRRCRRSFGGEPPPLPDPARVSLLFVRPDEGDDGAPSISPRSDGPGRSLLVWVLRRLAAGPRWLAGPAPLPRAPGWSGPTSQRIGPDLLDPACEMFFLAVSLFFFKSVKKTYCKL